MDYIQSIIEKNNLKYKKSWKGGVDEKEVEQATKRIEDEEKKLGLNNLPTSS